MARSATRGAARAVLEGRVARVRWAARGWRAGRRAIVELAQPSDDGGGGAVVLLGPLPTLAPEAWLRVEARARDADGAVFAGARREYDVVAARVAGLACAATGAACAPGDAGWPAARAALAARLASRAAPTPSDADDARRLALWDELARLEPLYGCVLAAGLDDAAVRAAAHAAAADPLALVLAPPHPALPALTAAHVDASAPCVDAARRVDALRAAAAEGHWWCAREDAVDAALAARGGVVVCGERTYLAAVHACEQRLAGACARIAVRARDYADTLPPLALDALAELSPAQCAAAQRVHASGLAVVSGGAGCGKTRLVCALVRSYGDAALVCAFTGRSSDVLRTRVGRGATLHSVLHALTRERGRKRRRGTSALVLIVDEAQMAPAAVLADLVAALAERTLQKLVLVGDAAQLDAIGCGSVLSELAAARACTYVELAENHRTDARPLVENARRVRAGDAALEYDGGATFVRVAPPPDLGDAAQCEALVRALGAGADALLVGATRATARRLNAACTRVRLGAADRVPFASRFAAYGPRGAPLRRLRPGDRVTFRRNATLRLDGGAHVAVVNGELAQLRRVVDVTARGVELPRADTAAPLERTHARRLVLDDGRVVPLARDWDTRGYTGVPLCDVELGYATTAHRAQGCEADTLVLVLDDEDEARAHPPTRAHIYTAVTRARRRVVVVASERALAAAIARPAPPRRTTLAAALDAAADAALAAPRRPDAAGFARHALGAPAGAPAGAPR